jgi:hypothetical protein
MSARGVLALGSKCQRSHKGSQRAAEKPLYGPSVLNFKAMQLTIPRPHFAPFGLAQEPVRLPAARYANDRARRSGGPQDRALYSCSCGFAFKAKVTTTVGCPHCGQTQAW